MKILRLLLNTNCNRKCIGCCNNQFDLINLPRAESFDNYKMIILTGGEPMLKPDLVRKAIREIREETNVPIILYTAKVDRILEVSYILGMIEGLTLSLHEQKDVSDFVLFNKFLKQLATIRTKSLRLNVFENISLENVDTSLWKVKDNIVWLDPCPLPKDEVFLRY